MNKVTGAAIGIGLAGLGALVTCLFKPIPLSEEEMRKEEFNPHTPYPNHPLYKTWKSMMDGEMGTLRKFTSPYVQKSISNLHGKILLVGLTKDEELSLAVASLDLCFEKAIANYPDMISKFLGISYSLKTDKSGCVIDDRQNTNPFAKTNAKTIDCIKDKIACKLLHHILMDVNVTDPILRVVSGERSIDDLSTDELNSIMGSMFGFLPEEFKKCIAKACKENFDKWKS